MCKRHVELLLVNVVRAHQPQMEEKKQQQQQPRGNRKLGRKKQNSMRKWREERNMNKKKKKDAKNESESARDRKIGIGKELAIENNPKRDKRSKMERGEGRERRGGGGGTEETKSFSGKDALNKDALQ